MRLRARRVGPMIGRLAGAIAAAALVISTLTAAPLASALLPATHTSARTATAESGITVSVAASEQGILKPGEALTVTATITNGSSTSLEPGTLTLWLNPRTLTSRSALNAWLAATKADAGSRVLGSAETTRLAPGTTASVQITASAASVALAHVDETAVYGIGATLSSGDATAVARGSLLWYPSGSTPSTNVAIAVPITVPATSSGLISSDDLATYTDASGLLTRQVDGLFGHPDVAIGLDPMILASIRVLGSSAPESVLQWRQKLFELPNDIFPLRYGDADAAGEVQSGITTLLKPTTLDWAMDAGDFTEPPDSVGETPQPSGTQAPTPGPDTPTPTPTSTSGPSLPSLDELLSWPYTMSGIVWPADNTVRAADLPVFAKNGLTTTIVSSGNITTGDATTTPNAALKTGGNTAVIADAAVSNALRQAVAASSDALWNQAMSELNAQLELIGQEKGPGTRTILATLDRSPPADALTLQRTLTSLSSAPWADVVTLPQAIASTPTPGVRITDAPEPDARVALIKRLTETEEDVDAFATVLDDPTTMTGPARVGLLSLLGTSWLNTTNDWTTAANTSLKASAATLQSIRIVKGSRVNVASTEAPIPITVENSLKQRVTIVLTASPSNGRLEIDGDAKKTLQADSRETVIVPVKATLGNGNVRLHLSLTSPTGVPIGSPETLSVAVHADWEGIGALIIAILVILLFGFGIVRNILRHRRERHAPPGLSAAPGTDAEPGTDHG